MSAKNQICNLIKVFGIFHFHHFFMKIVINLEHNLLPNCAFEPFTYVCCENGNTLYDNILFRSIPNGNRLLSSASLSLVGDNSLVYELRAMAAVELHAMQLNGQHPALKSVYEKRQPVMGGKLSSSL